jgi:hypothetical protein
MRFLYMDVMILRFIVKLSKMHQDIGQEAYNVFWDQLSTTWKVDTALRQKLSKTATKLSFEIDVHLPISCFAAKGNLEVIFNYYCIVEGNSLRFDLPYRRFNALCTIVNHTNNSCIPNSHVFLKEDSSSGNQDSNEESQLEDLTIVVKCGRDFTSPSFITICYVPIFFGTIERRSLLLDWYLLWCKCDRCMDPLESGTYLSSVHCPNCLNGKISAPSCIFTNSTPMAPLAECDTQPQKYVWTCNVNSQSRGQRCEVITGR